MSYDYNGWVAALANEAVIPATDADFVAILPTIIDLSEQRIYRELDLLSTVVRDTSGVLTANSRTFNLPAAQGRFVTTLGFNVFTPVNTQQTRNQLTPTSRDFIDATWPNEEAPAQVSRGPVIGMGIAAVGGSVPTMFAMITDQQIIVAPPPDAAYSVEVIGTIRPTPLSAENTTTFLTQFLPDLFFAASMVAVSGYMRNFGSQADDPKMAMAWSSQYDAYKSSAQMEEIRKKWQSVGGSSQSPSPANAPKG